MSTDEAFSLLDANANRAREGIRTAEDYTRFEILDKRWAERLRGHRHSVTAALKACFGLDRLIEARRVQLDCGRPGVGGEPVRSGGEDGPKAVALRGLKRGQEALRVLEEFTRSRNADAARTFTEARYGLYEAEQWLGGGSDASRILQRTKLYVLLSSEQCGCRGVERTVVAAIEGGAGLIQLREKAAADMQIIESARRLRDVCGARDAAFVVNDRVDIAMAAGAAGVHLGQDDLPPRRARELVGNGVLVGRSTHNVDEVKRAVEKEPVDYIAIGAMFGTATKTGTILSGLRFAEQVAAMELELPVFAIGGITKERIGDLRRAGVERIAVSSAVVGAPDPAAAARDLLDELEK